MTDWQKGDLALCVDTLGDDAYPGVITGRPIVGLIYTVAAVSEGFDIYGRGGVCLLLEEIRRPPHEKGTFAGYNAIGFRKVAPPKDMVLDDEELTLSTPKREPQEA